jgi:hypothetical protein
MDRKAGPFSFPLPDNSLELTGRENSMMPRVKPGCFINFGDLIEASSGP